jgi:hypothetical protein
MPEQNLVKIILGCKSMQPSIWSSNGLLQTKGKYRKMDRTYSLQEVYYIMFYNQAFDITLRQQRVQGNIF